MEPETIDISLGAIDEAIEIPKSTSNFGGGIELLMNEKVKSRHPVQNLGIVLILTTLMILRMI